MVVDLTVQKLAHWIHKEMQNNKHAKHTTFCLLFVTVKKKFKEVLGWAFMLDQTQILISLSFGHEPQSCLQREKLRQDNRKYL